MGLPHDLKIHRCGSTPVSMSCDPVARHVGLHDDLRDDLPGGAPHSIINARVGISSQFNNSIKNYRYPREAFEDTGGVQVSASKQRKLCIRHPSSLILQVNGIITRATPTRAR
jgi:hypothetical protein